MKKQLLLILLLTAALLGGCGDSNDGGTPPPPEPADSFTFRFEKSKNPQLAKDFEMHILDNNVIIGFLPNEAGRGSLKPTFTTVNDEGTLTCGGAVQQSGVSSQDFSSPVTYVLNQGGAVTTFTVKLFPHTGLPLVMLNTPGGKAFGQTIKDRENWVAGKIKIDGMGLFDDYDGDLSIRGRGNASWTFPKKGFNIKMAVKDPVLGMPKHKRWCFLGNWRDRTMLRNDVAFKIATITDNLDWTPRSRFAEVIFNGEHMGIYQVTEHIRVDKNRVNVDEMKAADVAEPAITGGYLLEIDQYYDEEPKFRTPAPYNLPVMSKNPDEDVMQPLQKSYISNYLASVQTALQAGNYSEVYNLIDRDSFIDYWLVFAITGNYEMRRAPTDTSGPWSVFCHKPRGGKLFAGPVWDFDLSTLSTAEASQRGKTNIHLNSWWYNELFKDPAFKTAVKARFMALKSQLQTIPAYIDQRAQYIARSMELDWKLWPITANIGLLYDNLNGDETMATLTEAVTRMKTVFNGRMTLVENTVKAW